jgi:hypothetical protein
MNRITDENSPALFSSRVKRNDLDPLCLSLASADIVPAGQPDHPPGMPLGASLSNPSDAALSRVDAQSCATAALIVSHANRKAAPVRIVTPVSVRTRRADAS